jgi:hypothetical protein
MADEAIRFSAQVFKVQTLIDGGLRLTLDIGQIDPAVIVALFDAKQPGIILECAAVAVRPDKQKENRENGEVPSRSEWQS